MRLVTLPPFPIPAQTKIRPQQAGFATSSPMASPSCNGKQPTQAIGSTPPLKEIANEATMFSENSGWTNLFYATLPREIVCYFTIIIAKPRLEYNHFGNL